MAYLSPEEIIDMKKRYFFPNSMHFYRRPPHLVRGSMQYLYDSEGRRYADFFAGVTVVNCGHCNPEINAAVASQLDALEHTSIIYLTENMVRLAERLAGKLPGDISRSFFCCSGSEANEGALLLARMRTGRKGFLAFERGLHGRTALTMGVTGLPMWRIDPFPDPGVSFARSFYAADGDAEAAARASLASVDAILSERGGDIAACIAEPIQGNGGIVVPPRWFFRELKERLSARGILLILDEVQTGFCRAGTFFASEYFGVVPDVLTCAKALGNGLPIGAFSATEAVAAAFDKPSASTLGGNPVSCAAGLAVLDYMDKHRLGERAVRLGSQLRKGLESISRDAPRLRGVRGLGLMLGAELVSEDGAPDPLAADRVLEAMKDRGFIVGKNGLHRNVLAFQPPLVVESEDIESMLENLAEVVRNETRAAGTAVQA